ncbi:hypothetical protein [Spartinivicinus poritis]|uniref:RHS repeat protein n=1 Tax=Spartinivicinus poritis TaxID=2994640 RepID=A0ABT5U9W8_9GAMM|nr:hypothetical protein [Spartinivicinus sp. A2-2]MDE1463158.1 hypothetical protein [Spartinivicinus sp. A2-2]
MKLYKYFQIFVLGGSSLLSSFTWSSAPGVCWYYSCYITEDIPECGTCYSTPKAGCDAEVTEDRYPSNDRVYHNYWTRGFYGTKYSCGVKVDWGGVAWVGDMWQQSTPCQGDKPYLDPETMSCIGKNSPQLSQNGSGDCTAPSTTPAAGNPVRISTGNKYQVEKIFNYPLPVNISYNSSNGQWTHSFYYQLSTLETLPEYKRYSRPDGKIIAFYNNDPLEAGSITLAATEQHNANWQVNYHGQKEYYDNAGHILRIESKSGNVLTFTRAGEVLTVADSTNKQLKLTFNEKQQLIKAESIDQQKAEFIWDDKDRLTQVKRPGNKTRQYHYENEAFPYHLTGITDENGVRFATWTYDNQGRAISSEHAGGKEKVTLEFHDNNSTTVTNPLGKKTTYHFQQFNGVNKVVRVAGHQSANCAAANKEYSYYPNGLLKTKTDWKGNTTEYKYNDQGLQIEKTEAVGTPQARTITTEWDVEKRLPLKASDGQLETQYQYDEKGLLINKKQVSK